MRPQRSAKRVNRRFILPELTDWLKAFRRLAGVKVRPDLYRLTPSSRWTGRITVTNRVPTGLRIRVNTSKGYQIFYVFFVASQRESVKKFLTKPLY